MRHLSNAPHKKGQMSYTAFMTILQTKSGLHPAGCVQQSLHPCSSPCTPAEGTADHPDHLLTQIPFLLPAGHNVVLEIQATMPSKPSPARPNPTKKPMMLGEARLPHN